MHTFPRTGLGWQRDLPDPRDFVASDGRVREMLAGLSGPARGRAGRPAQVDWREYFPPAADQQGLGSSPAHACGLPRVDSAVAPTLRRCTPSATTRS